MPKLLYKIARIQLVEKITIPVNRSFITGYPVKIPRHARMIAKIENGNFEVSSHAMIPKLSFDKPLRIFWTAMYQWKAKQKPNIQN